MAPIDTQDSGNASASALKSNLTLNKSAKRLMRPESDAPQSAPETASVPVTHGINLFSPLTIGIFALAILLGGAMVFLPEQEVNQVTKTAIASDEIVLSPEINVIETLSEIAPVSAPITAAIPP